MDQAAESSAPWSAPVRGIVAQVVANASLLIAVLVYMGWAYEDALFGYFHVSPLDLGVGLVEYMLRSLALFSPSVVVVAVIIVVIATIRAQEPGAARFRFVAVSALRGLHHILPAQHRMSRWLDDRVDAGRLLLTVTGAGVVTAALILVVVSRAVPVNTYALLLLLGVGPLLLTLPARAAIRGRFPHALAIVVAAVCALWAASLYAHNAGIHAARSLVAGLPSRAAVVVYSVRPLALSGPGITSQRIPGDFYYHYQYQGFRLLLTRNGTYYLLPVGWNPAEDITYVFGSDSEVRIELLSSIVRPGG